MWRVCQVTVFRMAGYFYFTRAFNRADFISKPQLYSHGLSLCDPENTEPEE